MNTTQFTIPQLLTAAKAFREHDRNQNSENAMRAALEKLPDVAAELRPITQKMPPVPDGCTRRYFYQYENGGINGGSSVFNNEHLYVDLFIPPKEDPARAEFDRLADLHCIVGEARTAMWEWAMGKGDA